MNWKFWKSEPEQPPEKKTLMEVFEEFRKVNLRIQSPRTIENYERSIRRFGEHLGRVATVGDLTDHNLAQFMSMLLELGKSAPTTNNHVKSLKAIWRFAAGRGYIQRISYAAKLIEPDPDTCTWSMEQLSLLFQACERQPGYIGPVRARDWWLAFHMIAWDSAERTGAILRIKMDWINFEGATIDIPPAERKGGQKWGRYRLRPETVAVLNRMRTPEREFLFEGLEHRMFHRKYNALLQCAGLPLGRRNGPQRIRRTVATLFKVMGGDPTELLQHTDPRVTQRSYMDIKRLPNHSPAEIVPQVVWSHRNGFKTD